MRKLAVFLVFACAAFAAEEGGAAKRHVGGDYLPQKWINFAILAGGIGFLAVKMGGPAFRAKKQGILDGLAEGTRRAEAAAEKAAEIDRHMAGLQDDVAALRAKANLEMSAEVERLRLETAELITKVGHGAELDIASAAKAARQELKVYVADLALDLARQKVAAKIDDTAQAALVDRFARGLNN
jgi:F0F1-type ATP synthase membrane subunit b/b'